METALLGMTFARLQQVAVSAGMPRFKGAQMARRLYVQRVRDIDSMTELSVAEREKLKRQGYTVGRQEPLRRMVSRDGTVKYLFPGVGGRDIEAVYIPDGERATLCVSSQAGCRMGCRFCMTGHEGWQGNLTAADILNQVFSIPESRSLTNIVFMGMGEPLDNLPEVLQAIEVLTARWGLAWSPKRITVSTIGKLPELQTLLEKTKVHIALSLHATTSRSRAEVMPVERAFPAEKVLDVLRRYDFASQRRLSIEYIMWEGVNDSAADASRLVRLLHGLECRVNLIRYHATPFFAGQPPTDEDMERFRDMLNARGITATIRTSRGEDIAAACGMLSGAKRCQP